MSQRDPTRRNRVLVGEPTFSVGGMRSGTDAYAPPSTTRRYSQNEFHVLVIGTDGTSLCAGTSVSHFGVTWQPAEVTAQISVVTWLAPKILNDLLHLWVVPLATLRQSGVYTTKSRENARPK